MTSITDYHNYTETNFIKFVESLNTSDLPAMTATRILPSFLNAMHAHRISAFSQTALTYWAVEMMNHAMKRATVQRYLGALHTLYKEWKGSPSIREENQDIDTGDDLDFSMPKVTYDDQSIAELKQKESNLQKAEQLSKINKKPHSKDYTYLNALIYLLINPVASVSELVDLKFSDPQPDVAIIEDIKLAMRNMPQAQYVFPLEQGKRRKPAIIHDLLRGMRTAARPAGLDFGASFSRESITAIWITAAMRDGVSLEEIRTIVKILPPQFSFMSLIAPATLTEEKKDEIMSRVATSFINSNIGWYVMRLRSGVTPEYIKEELRYRKYPLLRQVEFYSPMKTVKKLIKKKAVAVDVPVLPGILFFRMRYDKISKMMGLIGDLAWCYRTTNTATSPYSAIPQREMKTFQRSVGSLTADIEMDIIASQPPLNIGDEVIIENGTPLDGQQAVIRKVRSTDGSLSYTLRLSDSEFIHWKEVTLTAAHLTKVKDNNKSE